MGTLKIFTIKDTKAEAYLSPMFIKTTALAIRSFQTCANDPEHDFAKFPSDYTLFEIGIYDEEKGEIKMHDAKINLGLASEHIQPKKYSNQTAHIQQLEN